MSSSRDLDSAQAREIEEQLFSVHRQQLPRQVPIPLPRQDFWEMIRKLLSSLDLDIQEMMRNGSIDMRLQNLQKRQTNIRRIASELARKRMVAMMQHAASQSLRSAVNPGMTQELPALDWQRNDPAEKAFYSSLENQVDRFKKEIDWMGMQQGIAGEVGVRTTTHAPGTMQLDAFVKEGMLTSQPPPNLVFEDELPPLEEADMDEEDRFLAEPGWGDEATFLMPETSTEQAPPIETASTQAPDNKHAAAMELAPSAEPMMVIEELPSTEEQIPEQQEDLEDSELIRVRIVQSSPEPILTEQGDELMLEAGDVHFLDEDTAGWLVDAGVAERADL
ncbi:MAG: hypothetical protein L7S56_03660 [Candidatus Poseidonia sp.]|nr:hypothetical protein [Poseidonia sp.]